MSQSEDIQVAEDSERINDKSPGDTHNEAMAVLVITFMECERATQFLMILKSGHEQQRNWWS